MFRYAIIAALLAGAFSDGTLSAQANKASNLVKVTIGKFHPADKNKEFTVTLDIDKECYLYARNVANEFLDELQAKLEVKMDGVPVNADIVYPPGDVVRSSVAGNFNVWRGKVDIRVKLERPVARPSSVEIAIYMMGMNERRFF